MGEALRAQPDATAADGQLTARLAEMERATWQRRIAEIASLIDERGYPEAKRLAERLAADTAAPPDVRNRARELAAKANLALKRIFGATGFSRPNDQLQHRPPPPT